jgi:hypothetical protein
MEGSKVVFWPLVEVAKELLAPTMGIRLALAEVVMQLVTRVCQPGASVAGS